MEYEITRDPFYLEQYYRIRERGFRDDLGLIHFDGSEDEWDRSSYILIARDGQRCLGGMRISGRYPRLPLELPVEAEGLRLAQALPELGLDTVACCQWSRLAVSPEFRAPELHAGFGDAIIEYSRMLGFSYSITVTGMNQARFYKRRFSLMGYRYDILNRVQVPVEAGFDGLPHLLSVGYLREQSAAVTPLLRVA